MKYTDFTYYKSEYHGTLGEDDFTRLFLRASAYLDRLTFGRIQESWVDDTRVKLACCAVVDALWKQEQGGEVASASNDGYTESYVTSGTSPQDRLYEAAALYLANTGLLYTGCGG